MFQNMTSERKAHENNIFQSNISRCVIMLAKLKFGSTPTWTKMPSFEKLEKEHYGRT